MDLSPMTILREAQKAVPAIRYALGIAGIAAVVAIIAGFQLDLRVAVFGTVIMFGLMFVLVVFARVAAYTGPLLVIPALVATWVFMILTTCTATLLMTSYFFSWPRTLEDYLPSSTTVQPVVVSSRQGEPPPPLFLDEKQIRKEIYNSLHEGNISRAIELSKNIKDEAARQEECKHIYSYCLRNAKLKEAERIVNLCWEGQQRMEFLKQIEIERLKQR